MKPHIFLKQGDTWPPLLIQLLDGNKNLIAIEDAQLIRFIMTKYQNRKEVIIDSEISGLDVINGEYWLSYLWQEQDTINAGNYQAEFIVYLDEDKIITVPNGNDYLYIEIGHELG